MKNTITYSTKRGNPIDYFETGDVLLCVNDDFTKNLKDDNVYMKVETSPLNVLSRHVVDLNRGISIPIPEDSHARFIVLDEITIKKNNHEE